MILWNSIRLLISAPIKEIAVVMCKMRKSDNV